MLYLVTFINWQWIYCEMRTLYLVIYIYASNEELVKYFQAGNAIFCCLHLCLQWFCEVFSRWGCYLVIYSKYIRVSVEDLVKRFQVYRIIQYLIEVITHIHVFYDLLKCFQAGDVILFSREWWQSYEVYSCWEIILCYLYVSDEDLLKYFYAGDVNVAYSGLASTDTDKSCPISNQEID
jgi:hypothetical protein